MRAVRLGDAPLISPESHPEAGDNIQGPSLVRVPEWVEHPLGRYYLYFADHKGDSIRMAYADALGGPWTLRPGGTLRLDDSLFLTEPPEASEEEITEIEDIYRTLFGDYQPPNGMRSDITHPHIASPDVRINEADRTFEMYYHGLELLGLQMTRFATSSDGLHFDARQPTVEGTYLRAFSHREAEYAFVMPGTLLRRLDDPTAFDRGPVILPRESRHAAVHVDGDDVQIYWTLVGDAPERIYLSRIDGSRPFDEWTVGERVEVLRPERVWEGAEESPASSARSVAPGFVNQLRDPAIFTEDGQTYLLYAIGGESGIAIAELVDD